MNKRYPALILAALLLFSPALAGCGSSDSGSYDLSSPREEPAAAEAMQNSLSYDTAAEEESGVYGTGGGIAGSEGQKESGSGEIQAEKIIYSADAEIETIDYEAAIQGVYDLVERYGGFVESSGISGSNYYRSSRGLSSLRSASFTLRIPSENFHALTSSLSDLGNVPYCNTSSQNVTARYYDIQSRLDAYTAQQTRLMEMLEIAKTVEDMLAIQQQLTEVQYQIDSLQSSLTNYDRQVSYSTVTLYVQEVEEYTEQPVVTLSYWEKMSSGFVRSLKNVGKFFADLFLWLVANLPVLVLVAAVFVALIALLLRWRRKVRDGGRKTFAQRRAERRAKRLADRQDKKDLP